METSFPDRHGVLIKCFLIEILIFIILILAMIGCEPNKEYGVEPVSVFSRVLRIDSGYTTVEVISTGRSNSLFCGRTGIFDSYSIIKFDSVKFDSISENFDSLFLRFSSEPFTCELTFFALKQEWSEDSLYKWDDIGSLFDTLNPVQVDTIYPLHVISPDPVASSSVGDTNSLIFLGDFISLDESTIDAIGNFGLAVHSDRFYSFDAEETKLKIKSYDTLAPSVIDCAEDAYIVSNPFQDSIIGDSLLVGRGLRIWAHLFLPRDSLPVDLNSIAKADLCFGVFDPMPFRVRFWSSGSNYLYTRDPLDSDTLKFDLHNYFKWLSHDSILHLQIRPTNELGGIDVTSLEDIEDIGIQFIWVEFPR